MKKDVGSLKGLPASIGIVVLCLAIAGAIYFFIIRPVNLNWGLDRDGESRHFPGDELLPNPDYISTHAVTIEARVEDIWPWLAQIGQNRGGFYSYTWIENLMGFRMRNTDRVIEPWQTIGVGDEIKLTPSSGMVVAAVEKPRHIVCKMNGEMSTWAFFLDLLPEGRSRLISRLRMNTGMRPWWHAIWIDAGHFIMDRKMLTGIKARAERQAGRSSLFALEEWIWGITLILCGMAIPVLFFYHHRPWNGISAGIMVILWVIYAFLTYASMVGALVFMVLFGLAFAGPRRWRSDPIFL